MNFYQDLMQTYDKNGTVEQTAKEFGKRITYITKLKWHVVFRDRGLGFGDYAVAVNYKKKQIILFECPCQEIAQHVCKIHNEFIVR